jgi:predicted nucleic acid-binding protein
VVSPEILIEVELRLRDKEFNLATTEIKAILLDIIERCEIVRPNPPRDAKFENLKDSHLAAIAQNQLNDLAKPVVLLTGDDALLRQGNIGDCRIFEIGEFCNSGMHLPRD